MNAHHDMRQGARATIDAAVMSPGGTLHGEGELLPESSVRQARWLLVPVFSLYGVMMLAGLFL
jgi:hypothetical protein